MALRLSFPTVTVLSVVLALAILSPVPAAATHNITIAPTSVNIDGSATYIMSINYQAVGVTYSGTQSYTN